ncbi:hypothetical protein Q8F55_008362 [Vanrija albida]|uniref:Uncharacterized protein n=1 Tax=Vanrija albida TaxID=181172 RepID=A0ABR3PW25_9TREE
MSDNTDAQHAALTRLVTQFDATAWPYDLLIDADGALAVRLHDEGDLGDDFDPRVYDDALGDIEVALAAELAHVDGYVVEEGVGRKIEGHMIEDVLAAGLSRRSGLEPAARPPGAAPDPDMLKAVQRRLAALDSTGEPYTLAVVGGGLVLDANPSWNVPPSMRGAMTDHSHFSMCGGSIDSAQVRRGLDDGPFVRLRKVDGRYDEAEIAALLVRPEPPRPQLEDKGVDWDNLLGGEEVVDDDAAARTWG